MDPDDDYDLDGQPVCHHCGGRGEVLDTDNDPEAEVTNLVTCQSCGGTGKAE